MRSRVSPGAALFFLLLSVSVVTAVLVVRARTPDLVLEVTGGLPCSLDADRRAGDGVAITFFVREPDAAARVAIVDGRERVVRTLDESVALSEDEEVTYVWEGRSDAGVPASTGRYRLLVELPEHERQMIWPRRITVGGPAGGRACDAGGGQA